MGEIVVRQAIPQEAPVITMFLRKMVNAIAAVGAPVPVHDEQKWQDIQVNIKAAIEHDERIYLLAEQCGEEKKPIGFIEASIFSLPVVYEPRKILHVHSLYVIDAKRRTGVATQMMESILAYAKEKKCTEAELDTLVANPARGLFEKLGFAVSEHNMKKPL